MKKVILVGVAVIMSIAINATMAGQISLVNEFDVPDIPNASFLSGTGLASDGTDLFLLLRYTASLPFDEQYTIIKMDTDGGLLSIFESFERGGCLTFHDGYFLRGHDPVPGTTTTEIIKFDPVLGTELGVLPSPTSSKLSGLTSDGTNIFAMNLEKTIFKIDPDSGSVLNTKTSAIPGYGLGSALAFNNGSLFAATWDTISMLNPSDFSVLDIFDPGITSIKAMTFVDDKLFINNGGNTIKVYSIPEPATPPVADADGPYSIFVGDTLTLDGSGSTDADDDIVSYVWDLDDDGTFETEAGSQTIFDVNYASLESLGLLINYTYTIHLKVTDSKDQSDTADSTLIIVPKPAVKVALDIKPGSCPNPVNVKSSGVLPVAILGSADFDVTTIDATSVQLAGVGAIRYSYEDVAAPVSDENECECTVEGPDGYTDLTLKFDTQAIVEALGEVIDGEEWILQLTGVLHDDIPIEGEDCIVIRSKSKHGK